MITAHSERFPSSPTSHTTSPSSSSIQLEKDKERREGASNHKTWIDEEGDVVCVVGLEGNRSLWAVIIQLIPNSTLNNCRDYNKQELINKRGVFFHHDNARLHIFDDSAKIARTWLGSQV